MQQLNKLKILNEFRHDGKLRKLFYFALIGGTGIIVNTLILFLLSEKAGVNYLLASGIATETAIITNFIGNNYITFKNERSEGKISRKFISFQLISLITLAGTMFLLYLMVNLFGRELLLVWNLIAILAMFIANFLLNMQITWRKQSNKKYHTGSNVAKIKGDASSERIERINRVLAFAGILFLCIAWFLPQESFAQTVNPAILSENVTYDSYGDYASLAPNKFQDNNPNNPPKKDVLKNKDVKNIDSAATPIVSADSVSADSPLAKEPSIPQNSIIPQNPDNSSEYNTALPGPAEQNTTNEQNTQINDTNNNGSNSSLQSNSSNLLNQTNSGNAEPDHNVSDNISESNTSNSNTSQSTPELNTSQLNISESNSSQANISEAPINQSPETGSSASANTETEYRKPSRTSTERNSGPEFIYALFDKDVISVNDNQTLRLDAKAMRRGLEKVEADVLTPQGQIRTYSLELIQGNNDYGTWAVTFKSIMGGKYTLSSVDLYEKRSQNATHIDVSDNKISFYSVENQKYAEVAAGHNLTLIYTALSQNDAENGSLIEIQLDSRDSQGVTGAWAEIETTKGNNVSQTIFSVPLSLSAGEAIYGTWKGTFNVTEPDSTYAVKNVTLRNGHEEKTYPVSDRSVYVHPLPQITSDAGSRNGNQITGFSIFEGLTGSSFSEIMSKPLTPTILGFLMMAALVTTFFTAEKKKKRKY